MFIRRALALVLAILWLWPAGLYAQSEALQVARRQGLALYEAGQYEQAISFWWKVSLLKTSYRTESLVFPPNAG